MHIKIFLSDNNINDLNQEIVKYLYKKTGYIIEHQNKRDMLIVMKYVHNRDNHLKATIAYLNDQFLKEILPQLEHSFTLHLKYLESLNSLNGVNDYPIYQSNRKKLVNTRILK